MLNKHFAMATSSSNTVGAGCIIGFGSIFFFAGLAALSLSIPKVLQHEKDAWIGLLVGGIFVLVGGGIIVGGLVGRKVAAREQSLKELHPDKQWMWKSKWATGEIADGGKTGVIMLWFFTIVWNAISFPAAFVVFPQVFEKHEYGPAFVLLFPLIGVLLLAGAIFSTARQRRFGTSYFRPEVMPASPGTMMTGTIRVSANFEAADGVTLRLVCVHSQVTGSGNDTHTTETILWEDSQKAEPLSAPGVNGVIIPVKFFLPADAQTTDNANSRDQRIWRLHAKASLPGPDYSAQFELPVFETPESIAAIAAAKAERESGESPTEFFASPPTTDSATTLPTEPGVTATRRIDGGWDFNFAAGRNKGFAVALLVFGLIFGGVTGFLIYNGLSIVPLLMAVPFGLVTLLLLGGAIQMVTAQVAVIVSRGEIAVQKSSPILRSNKKFSAADVKDVTIKITASAGDKAYYSILVQPTAGSDYSIASGIASKRDAQWIADRIKESLGVRGV